MLSTPGVTGGEAVLYHFLYFFLAHTFFLTSKVNVCDFKACIYLDTHFLLNCDVIYLIKQLLYFSLFILSRICRIIKPCRNSCQTKQKCKWRFTYLYTNLNNMQNTLKHTMAFSNHLPITCQSRRKQISLSGISIRLYRPCPLKLKLFSTTVFVVPEKVTVKIGDGGDVGIKLDKKAQKISFTQCYLEYTLSLKSCLWNAKIYPFFRY